MNGEVRAGVGSEFEMQIWNPPYGQGWSFTSGGNTMSDSIIITCPECRNRIEIITIQPATSSDGGPTYTVQVSLPETAAEDTR